MTDKQQPEALELASVAESADLVGYPTAKKANAYYLCLLEDCADVIRKLHAENESLRAKLKTLRAFEGLPAAQEPLGVEFERVLHDNLFDLYEESPQTASHGQAPAGESLRTDALCDLSYSHGLKAGWNCCASDDFAGFERAQKIGTEALRTLKSATAQPAPAAVAGPSGYGPKVTVKRRCSDCKACNSESYAVQGDSGHYVYCEHPSLPERKYIGDTHWDTPDWCPAAAPTTQPAPQQEPILYDPKALLSIFLNAQAGSSGTAGTLRGITAVIASWESRAEPHTWLIAAPQPSPAAQGDALDAARYRWLTADHHKQEDRIRVYEIATSMNVRGKGHIDAAIDAARAAQEDKSCPKE